MVEGAGAPGDDDHEPKGRRDGTRQRLFTMKITSWFSYCMHESQNRGSWAVGMETRSAFS